MNITKLDDFSEGFKVAPRKAHSISGSSPLTQDERLMKVSKVVKARLENHGVCHVSIFADKDRRNASGQMTKLHRNGVMQLERIGTAKNLIGYKVAEQ